MAYVKHSVIIELLQVENGYVLRVWKWPSSPPPVRYDLDNTSPLPDFRQDHVAATKTELKTKFGLFVDSILG